MKLSDFLTGVGRPVAFYPGLAKALGSIKQAIFVCQLAYWKDKGDDPNGWIYKTAEEIETETALTYKEQTKVRDDLKAINALEERYARTEHKMYFRINWDVLNNLWEEHLTKSQLPYLTKGQVPSYQKSTGSLPKVSSLNSNTETTAETTHKKDILDGIIETQLKPKAIQDAIRTHFKLTPNWEMKSNRQFMQWAIQECVTPDQIKAAATLWGKDKRFNWAHPNLKGIQEHWLQLIEGNGYHSDDGFMAELELKRERVRAQMQGAK